MCKLHCTSLAIVHKRFLENLTKALYQLCKQSAPEALCMCVCAQSAYVPICHTTTAGKAAAKVNQTSAHQYSSCTVRSARRGSIGLQIAHKDAHFETSAAFNLPLQLCPHLATTVHHASWFPPTYETAKYSDERITTKHTWILKQ